MPQAQNAPVQPAQPKISPAQEAVMRSAAAQDINEKPGKLYKTTANVGPFRHQPAVIGTGTESKPQFPAVPYVFSEAEFARLHPIPDSPAARATIDPDTYFPALLKRLIDLGSIQETPAGSVLTQAPPQDEKSLKNPGIDSSTQSVLQHRRNTEMQRAADQQKVAMSQAK